MNRSLAVLVAFVVVAAVVPAGAALAPDGETEPGAKLAGVVGVQGAEVQSELAERTFEERLRRADSNASKAAVVASQVEDIDERLAELRQRREALEKAFANGSISQSTYRARLATIAATTQALERQANRSAAVARGLPEQVLEKKGVNVSRIERLRASANELNDGRAREIAREIAGKGIGDGLGGPPESAGPPGDAGPPDDAGPPGDDNRTETGRPENAGNASDAGKNASDAAGQAPDAAENATDRAGDTGASGDVPENANGSASNATGSDAGDGNAPRNATDRAEESAENTTDRASETTDGAQNATDTAGGDDRTDGNGTDTSGTDGTDAGGSDGGSDGNSGSGNGNGSEGGNANADGASESDESERLRPPTE